MKIVVLYETPGCGLCAEAAAALDRLGGGRRFAVRRVDVSAVPALVDRYALRVPVLAVGAAELDAAGLPAGALGRWLEEALRGTDPAEGGA